MEQESTSIEPSKKSAIKHLWQRQIKAIEGLRVNSEKPKKMEELTDYLGKTWHASGMTFDLVELALVCPDIGDNIIGRLDISSGLKCRLVCRNWKELVEGRKRFWRRVQQRNNCQYRYWTHGTRNKETALHIAARHGGEDICRVILDSLPPGCSDDVRNPPNRHGYTPLHRSARFGHIDVCRMIMETLDETKNPSTSTGSTPLHEAAEEGHPEICRLMLENIPPDDNCNPPDNVGDTPLHHAARSGLTEICQEIMSSIVVIGDKNPCNEDGTTPLHDAAIEGHLDIVKLILEQIDNNKNPADIESGDTPLHFAARGGHTEICREILQQVDNKNPMNEVEVTPLWHAVMEGHTEVCKLIVNSIVDSDVEVLKSKTDLDKYLNIAVEKGHQEIIRFLNDAKFLFG